MGRITATQAISLSYSEDQLVKSHLDFIDEQIKKACDRGQLSVMIPHNPYAYWLYHKESSRTNDVKRALKDLKDRGFNVRLHYKEQSMGVDIALVVEWGSHHPSA